MSNDAKIPPKATHSDLDLSRFPSAEILGNRSFFWRAAWLVVSAVIFQSRLPLLPSAVKSAVLRTFGAQIGSGAVIKPRVTIKYPWFLEAGENLWIGEMVWIDNPGQVTIGANVCLSQGVYMVTGNHDYSDAGFRFFARPVTIGDRAWVCARAIIPPGSEVASGTVVPIGSVWQAHRGSAALSRADSI